MLILIFLTNGLQFRGNCTECKIMLKTPFHFLYKYRFVFNVDFFSFSTGFNFAEMHKSLSLYLCLHCSFQREKTNSKKQQPAAKTAGAALGRFAAVVVVISCFLPPLSFYLQPRMRVVEKVARASCFLFRLKTLSVIRLSSCKEKQSFKLTPQLD